MMIKQNLNGAWALRHESLSLDGQAGHDIIANKKHHWLAATVPGDVHLDLVAAGKMEEPLLSTNAPDCRWVEDRSWWYKKTFTVTDDLMQEHIKELVFHGLDYYAQVYVNGHYVGSHENALVEAVFDISDVIELGENFCVVRLTVGTERATNQEVGESGKGPVYSHRQSFKGTPELRKPQFTYGWDWVDSLPNVGIWRDVELCAHSIARVDDLRHVVSLEGESCTLDVRADIGSIHPWSEYEIDVDFSLSSPTGKKQTFQVSDFLPVGGNQFSWTCEVEDPQLWWPNGMIKGRQEQPLYSLSIQVFHNGVLLDTRTQKIGLRTISINRDALPEGHRFAIQVNGEDVFCKGANWIPADAIIARTNKERYHHLINEAREMNFTMLRIWGGGIYESKDFYEACDEMGILVWQDFMFACHEYPDDSKAFQDKIRHEATLAIKRLRHHPSIALWCANNENTWAYKDWWNGGTEFPAKNMNLGGQHLYGKILPDVCRQLDDSRPYWPGSPAGGEDANSETEGDCHWWKPFTMNEDVNKRIHHEVFDECRSRFVSEYGIIGPCHIDTIKTYLKPEECEVGSFAWQVHTNYFEQETLPAAIRTHYAEPEGLPMDAYVIYGQLFQSMMYSKTLESLRFRKRDINDDCQGALIWMFNDCWGETGWTPVDYYLRRKPSFYGMKDAFAPVRAIVRQRQDKLVVRVVSDLLQKTEVNVRYGWLRYDGTEVFWDTTVCDVSPNGMVEIDQSTLVDEKDHKDWFFCAIAEGEGIETVPATWFGVDYRQRNTVIEPIQVHQEGNQLALKSSVYLHGVHMEDGGGDLLSDNYFDLIPGVEKVLRVKAMPTELQFKSVLTPVGQLEPALVES